MLNSLIKRWISCGVVSLRYNSDLFLLLGRKQMGYNRIIKVCIWWHQNFHWGGYLQKKSIDGSQTWFLLNIPAWYCYEIVTEAFCIAPCTFANVKYKKSDVL